MKKYYCFLGLLLGILSSSLSAQTTYILTDSMMTTGLKMLDGGKKMNARFCQIEENKEIIKYSPYEVKEYGFKNGRIFKSLNIDPEKDTIRYFLERLVKGNINLYYLPLGKGNTRYFLSDCDSCKLIEIPHIKADRRKMLNLHNSYCSELSAEIPFVRFNKNDLTRYFRNYDYCSGHPIPRIRYGFMAGLNLTRLSKASNTVFIPLNNVKALGYDYPIPDFKNDRSVSIGAFLDAPLDADNFSFHPEILYQENHISQSSIQDNYSYNLVYNYSSLNFPFLMRYNLLKKTISSFCQAGLVYSHILRNQASIYRYQTVDNNIFVNESTFAGLQNNMFGFSGGAGMIYYNNSRHALSAEIGYTKLYNIMHENKMLNRTEISFLIGFLF